MKPQARIWFDVSYTRTQQGNIGITRTVRRLFQELGATGSHCEAVAFHSSGFRLAQLTDGASAATTAPAGAASRRPTRAERIFQWVTGSLARRVVLLAIAVLPWRLTRACWSMASAMTFDALTSTAEPVAFRAGDVLVLADASWNYPVWRAARLARAQGAQVVVVVYDLMPIRHPEFCFALVPPLFAAWLRDASSSGDALMCISQATEDDLRRWAGEQRLQLPPTGNFRLGSDVAARADTAMRAALATFVGDGRSCFAAIGSIEPKKNYEMLIAVFERLWARGEPLRLVIAGRPTQDCAALVERLHAHSELGKRLMLLHDASDAEIQGIYSGCRALLFPSLFEGFGLPLVEARTRGCLVLASDIPSFAELADDGVVLFKSNSHDALERAILDVVAGDAAHPGAHARAAAVSRMPPFTWRDSASTFLAVTHRLLDGSWKT